MGAAQSGTHRDGASSTEIFTALDDFFNGQRTRAKEVFREFDHMRTGKIDVRDMTSLALRLLPHLGRGEHRYIQNMVEAAAVSQLTFEELALMMRDCREIASSPTVTSDSAQKLKWALREALGNRRQEALKTLEPHTFMDSRRRQCLDPSQLVHIARSLVPSLSVAQARQLLTALHEMDAGGKGSVPVESVLEMLSLLGRGSGGGEGSPATGADRFDMASAPRLPVMADAPPPPQPSASERYAAYSPSTQEVGFSGFAPGSRDSLSDDLLATPQIPRQVASPPASPPPPPPAALQPQSQPQGMPASAKEDLRRAVEQHREHEKKLEQAMRGAQECMAVDADELRRAKRRLEDFQGRLTALAQKIEDSGHAVEEGLKSGFDRMQAVLVARAEALLPQAADVTAERLAMVRAQGERTAQTIRDVDQVLNMSKTALEERDPATVMSLNEKFEETISNLHESGRLNRLDPCTNEDLGLVVDFNAAKEELEEVLEFSRQADGVAGPLRGAAAMKLLKDVFQQVDKGREGIIAKPLFMSALRAEPRLADILKLPVMGDDAAAAGAQGRAETFEDTFRKIDVDSSDNLSWPEFASYFGKSYLQFPGGPPKKPSSGLSKVQLAKEIDRLQIELSAKTRTADEATEESARLGQFLEKAEAFAAKQAQDYEERVRALKLEQDAMRAQYEAKFVSMQEENAARQAEFEARLQTALCRSEEVLSREQAVRKAAAEPPSLPRAPPPDHQQQQVPDRPPSPAHSQDETWTAKPEDPVPDTRPIRPSSATTRQNSEPPNKPLYNNRAVNRDDRSAVPLRLQQAGNRVNNRGR